MQILRRWIGLYLGLLLLPITQFSAQEPVDVTVIRDAETLAIIVQGNVPISLDGLTIQATDARGEVTSQRLQDFPAFRGLPFTRILTPTCFYIRANSTNQIPPQECLLIDQQQVFIQQLPSANLFWYDAGLQVQNLIEFRRGPTSFALCGAQNVRCVFTYQPPQAQSTTVPATPAITTPNEITPCVANMTVGGLTVLRDGPSLTAQIVGNVSGGDYPVTGVQGNPASYWEIDYNGEVAYVNAGSLDITVKPDPCETVPNPVRTLASPQGNGPFTLQYSATATGRLPEGEVAIIRFTGLEGEIISVEVLADFDGQLSLFGDVEVPLIEDDDSGEDTNPQINGFTIPASGEYELQLRGYNNSQFGDYRVTLLQGTLETTATTCSIDYYETSTDVLQPNQEISYCFKGTAGDLITIDVQAAFDSYLQLQAPDGQIIADNDDRVTGDFNPLIELFTLPESGEYEIILRGYSPSSTGTFSLSLARGFSGNAQSIAYGQALMQRLVPATSAYFIFTGNEGNRVTIFVESDFDATLSLRNEIGEEIATDDDSGGNQQPALQDFVLPADGEYIIEITGFNEDEAGTFTVILSAR